jgi:hypothetical protein
VTESKKEYPIVYRRPSTILRLLTVVRSVGAVRPLGQALDLHAGERDAIEGLDFVWLSEPEVKIRSGLTMLPLK